MDSIKITVLQELLTNKSKYLISRQSGHTGVPDDGEGYMGEYNEYFKFYRHPEMPENLFMRETWHTDSYGSNDSIESIDFVRGREKQITIYEPI